MAAALLEIRDADIGVGSTAICRDISVSVQPGETHVLFGPNGSGKSSLLAAIMGLPPFAVTRGEMLFQGARLDRMSIDERARRGLGMAFQRPPSLEGVTIAGLSAALGADENLQREAAALDLQAFARRDINVGFSGGEIKRWEILKLFLQQPLLCLFDEPESGVDLEHIAAVGAAIDRLLRTPHPSGVARAALVITHTGFILDYIKADVGHMMVDGRIVYSGPAAALFKHIQRNGYRAPSDGAARSSA
jgi:Fe-S cluster assembly ATP-binding protein